MGVDPFSLPTLSLARIAKLGSDCASQEFHVESPMQNILQELRINHPTRIIAEQFHCEGPVTFNEGRSGKNLFLSLQMGKSSLVERHLKSDQRQIAMARRKI